MNIGQFSTGGPGITCSPQKAYKNRSLTNDFSPFVILLLVLYFGVNFLRLGFPVASLTLTLSYPELVQDFGARCESQDCYHRLETPSQRMSKQLDVSSRDRRDCDSVAVAAVHQLKAPQWER